MTEQRRGDTRSQASEERASALLARLPYGFAQCRMLYDAHDRPVDFVYLSVNEAFERLTGLSNVVGRPSSDVSPAMRELSPELFETYGRVASTGVAERFDFHCTAHQQWLNIAVYSVEKGTFVAVFDDITARKRTEDGLQLFRSLIDRSNDSIEVVDPETGRILDVNETACAALGYTREEMLAQNVLDIDATLDRSSFRSAVEALRKAGTLLHESQHRRKDGSTFPVEVNISVIGLEREYAIAVVRDLTVRKQAEESLADALRFATTVMDASPIGMITYKASGGVVNCNRSAADLVGATLDQLKKTNFRELEPWKHSGLLAAAESALTSNEPQIVEARFTSTFGKALWVYCRFVPFAHEHEAHLLLLMSDITDRKEATKLARLQGSALNAAATAIVITDRVGTFEWVNPAFTALTGYRADEAIGKNPRDLSKSGVHDSSFYRAMWDTILAGQVWRGEMTNRRKDGSLYPVHQTITPVRDDAGEITHFIAIQRDLTDQKRLEAEFLQAQKMEVVGQLASGIAHDFNNLLIVINGTAELALLTLANDDPRVADFQMIHSAGDRAASLTKQLLAFSRRQIMKPAVLNLSALVSDVQGMLERLIGEDIELVVVPPSEVGHVEADPGLIGQVVMNLAVNARDAMPDGGTLTIETRNVALDQSFAASHPSLPAGAYVMLAVSDTGNGMDEATCAQIFEPFFTTKTLGKGTGLGLSTVYGIVRQSGGGIEVTSELGKGTSFKIYLPRVEAMARKVSLTPPGRSEHGTETILLVEDEESVRRLAQHVLELAGYTVLTASNGMEALALLERHAGLVHLVLTDMVMPGMTGRELATQLKKKHPRTKVLFTSGYTDGGMPQNGLLDADTLFIGKPYSVAQLRRTVREVLDS